MIGYRDQFFTGLKEFREGWNPKRIQVENSFINNEGRPMNPKRKSILTGLTIVGIMGWLSSFPPMSLATNIPAPDIVSPIWLNTEPLKLKNLRGKVVMVELWTFGCWNCRNIEPYVK
jgi:hypothetical protein